MKVKVTVKPSSKYEKIEETFDGSLKVWVKEPAKEGRANRRVIKMLASYFHVNQSNIIILKGNTARIKIISIVGI